MQRPIRSHDEELHATLKSQIETKKLPPLEMREELINFARKQSLYKLMAEEYEEAAKIDDNISINMQNLQEDSISSDIFDQTYTIKQYLEQVHKATLEQVHKATLEQVHKATNR
ncbi:hypothetical protein M9Y10_037270 [Tritrichomonas musculus]|uniref:Uncharacterized protein n=1 Tax=Tritrichomonas musculus TaxID=1915356 RepID=A0ABR2GIP6_9EUKA